MAVEMINNVHYSTAILLGSIHARENITSDLLCKMIDENLFENITNFNISFIVMVNPDGVELSKNGLKSCPNFERKRLVEINNYNSDFSMWKANGRGVDLNNNFDADFKKFINSRSFSPGGFAGEFAESEIETKAILNYVKSIKPFFTISYHSKGEEIYYNYFQSDNLLKRDKIIAEKFEKSTGYLIKNVENFSCGGFKDYCVQTLKIPALTIEVGSDELSHPIGEEFLEEIYEKHKDIANDLDFAYNIYTNYK